MAFFEALMVRVMGSRPAQWALEVMARVGRRACEMLEESKKL